MENTGYSGTQKAKRHLTVLIEGNAPKSFESALSKNKQVTVIQSGPSDLAFYFKGKSLKVADFRTTGSDPRELNVSKSDWSSLLSLLQLNERKPATKFKKSSIESRIQSVITKAKDFPGASISLIRTALKFNTSFNQLESIEEIPEKILGLDSFHKYTSCQLLVHPKGSPTASSYSFRKTTNASTSTLDTLSFNSIFSMVKKSKNKNFDQSTITRNELDIVGTFLAKNIELEGHRILLILSREDFLPVDQEEQLFLDQATPLIATFLNYFFVIQSIDLRCKLIKKSLSNFPQPICINTVQGEQIFSNSAPIEDTSKTTELKNIDHTLKVYSRTEAPIITDLYHHQRISMLGELLNTLQHELSNPLFGLKLANDLVKMAPPVNDSEALSFLLEIDRYVDRSQKILENFRSLFKEVGDSYPTNISEIINEAITLAKSETREIKKTVELDENIVIDINPTWLTQIVFNLIINSAQALKENNNGSAQITISLIAEGNRAKIQVCDNGPGIDPSKLEQIFTPFYTTKAQGTGLGLSICQNLANKLGAHFYCDNNTTSPGVTFTLELNYT